MANFTIELGDLIEQGYKLALNDYPIFNEKHRHELNNKIIGHYYFREIGLETPDRFNFYLRQRMFEIMPYYNQLYESAEIKYNPLETEYIIENSNNKKNIYSTSTMDNALKSDIKNNEITESLIQNDSTLTNDTKTNSSSENESNKNGTEDTTNQNTREENLKENGTSNNTTHNTQEIENTSTGNNTINKTTNFSDVPETPITTITNSDGSVTTTSYLTTQTVENQHGTESTNSNSTTTDDGTASGENEIIHDNTITDNGSGTKKWTETDSGNSSSNGITNINENTNDIQKSNEEKNNIQSITSKNASTQASNNNEIGEKNTLSHGRSGAVPAKLIMDYRNTILNIDMLIIESLENLFMGVYE